MMMNFHTKGSNRIVSPENIFTAANSYSFKSPNHTRLPVNVYMSDIFAFEAVVLLKQAEREKFKRKIWLPGLSRKNEKLEHELKS